MPGENNSNSTKKSINKTPYHDKYHVLSGGSKLTLLT